MDAGATENKRTKKPTTFIEQISLLKNRNLRIEDEQQAIEILSWISYYRLSAYTLIYS